MERAPSFIVGNEITGEKGMRPGGPEVINLLFPFFEGSAQDRCGDESAAEPSKYPIAGLQFTRLRKFPFEPPYWVFYRGPQNATVRLDPKDLGAGHEEFVNLRLDDRALRVHG